MTLDPMDAHTLNVCVKMALVLLLYSKNGPPPQKLHPKICQKCVFVNGCPSIFFVSPKKAQSTVFLLSGTRPDSLSLYIYIYMPLTSFDGPLLGFKKSRSRGKDKKLRQDKAKMRKKRKH